MMAGCISVADKGVIIGPFGLEISSEVYIHPGTRLDEVAKKSQGTLKSDQKENEGNRDISLAQTGVRFQSITHILN